MHSRIYNVHRASSTHFVARQAVRRAAHTVGIYYPAL